MEIVGEAQWRALIDAAPDAMVIADEDGLIVLVNAQTERLFGFTRQELLNEPTERLLPERVAGLPPVGFRKDGTEFPAEISLSSFEAAGRHLVIAAVRDLTARRGEQAEQSLRLESAALRAASDAVLITDHAGAIEWVNPAFTRLTGYSSDEAIGKNPRDLVKSGQHAPPFYDDLWETIIAGRTWYGEMINRRKDGSLYTEEQSITPIRDAAGAITHFVAIKRDISGRLQLEAQFRQAQKLESVGQLAGGVAHDFNNLLTAILGYSNFVLDTFQAGDERRADLDEVIKAGERAATLARQLLTFSRKQALQPAIVHLNDLVGGIQKMLGRLIGEDIEFATVLAPGLHVIRADPGQLEQVLMNLVLNARDAMPTGGRVAVETANVELDGSYVMGRRRVSPGSYVMLAVSDDGIGMSKEVKRRLFEPFFTTKGLDKGTGLGLATVYGIVKQSGGYIWVYSEPGGGATFKVYLPSAELVSEVAQASEAAETAPTAGTETVLVVEDDVSVRLLTRAILEKAGYCVFDAPNPQEAEPMFEQHADRIDLIVTDVIMPGCSGPKLIERLVRQHPDLKVIYMSGYTHDAVVHQGQLDPGVEFLEKPFTADALARRVRETLDRSSTSKYRN